MIKNKLEYAIFFTISFLFILMLLYLFLPAKLDKFKKLDLSFSFLILFVVCARFLGMFMNWEGYSNLFWSVNPLSSTPEDTLILFESWPWAFLRIWDGNFDFSYYILLIVIPTFLTLLPFRKRIADIRKVADTFLILIATFISLFAVFQLIFPDTNLLKSQFNLFGLSFWLTIAIINLVGLLVGILSKTFIKNGVSVSLGFAFSWVVFMIVILISTGNIDNFSGYQFRYLEIIILMLILIAESVNLVFTFLNNKNNRSRKIDIQPRRRLINKS